MDLDMDQSDPLDAFEFKPLTEGLGFHKKAQETKTKSEVRALRTEREKLSSGSILDTPAPRMTAPTPEPETPRASKSISDLIASLPPSLDFTEKETTAPSRPQIFQPLAREEYKPRFEMPKVETPRPAQTIGQVLPAPGTKATGPTTATIAAPLVGGTKAPSPYRTSLDEGLARAFPHASRETTTAATAATPKKEVIVEGGLVAIPASLGASLLDAMVVTGMSTVLLVIVLAITKANLWGLLSNAQTDGPTQMHLVLLFLAVLQLYMLTARSFFGASLGEWAFDLQLGSGQEQIGALYPIKVAWRTILMTATGLILIPLLSLVFGRDLARYVTGLQLYHRP